MPIPARWPELPPASSLLVRGAPWTDGDRAARRALPGIEGDLARFLDEWDAPGDSVRVHTSGSTGDPRPWLAEKRRMAASALRTCEAVGLAPGMRSLLAMPLRYIGAKMVVVRALVRRMTLVPVEPCGNPCRRLAAPVDFACMTPMQAYESLRDPDTAEILRATGAILLGGGAVQPGLAAEIAAMPHPVWSTYGMTETLSHVALRPLNGPDADEWYRPLAGVRVSLSDAGTLLIDDPVTCSAPLRTNDLAEISPDGRFRIIGRLDNVISSGGVKVQVETAERLLAPAAAGDFCITSVPDDRLGEKVVLLCTDPSDRDQLGAAARDLLPRYWAPRLVLLVDGIPKTGTGKPARAEARRLAVRLAEAGPR